MNKAAGQKYLGVMDLGVTVLALACYNRSIFPAVDVITAWLSDSRKQAAHGRAAVYTAPFPPPETLSLVPWIGTEIQGISTVLASSGKALSCELQSFEMCHAKKCAWNHLIQSLLAFLFRKGSVCFQREITKHGGETQPRS